MAKVLHTIRYLLIVAVSAGILYFLFLLFPEPFFRYNETVGNITLYAEKPLPPNTPDLLKAVSRLLRRSTINDTTIHHRVFICNNLTLFGFLTRGRSNLGGLCDDRLTRNIFIRPADIAKGRILPPPEWASASDDRPLSYFIAHEITHSLESHAAGRWNVKIPIWLWEGYADYIGKGPDSFPEFLEQYRTHAPAMDPASGLYTRYELWVMYLLDYKGMDIKDLLRHPPALSAVEEQINHLGE